MKLEDIRKIDLEEGELFEVEALLGEDFRKEPFYLGQIFENDRNMGTGLYCYTHKNSKGEMKNPQVLKPEDIIYIRKFDSEQEFR